MAAANHTETSKPDEYTDRLHLPSGANEQSLSDRLDDCAMQITDVIRIINAMQTDGINGELVQSCVLGLVEKELETVFVEVNELSHRTKAPAKPQEVDHA